MGMQSFDKKGLAVGKADVSIAKNYLNQDEITLLGLIVEQYLPLLKQWLSSEHRCT